MTIRLPLGPLPETSSKLLRTLGVGSKGWLTYNVLLDALVNAGLALLMRSTCNENANF